MRVHAAIPGLFSMFCCVQVGVSVIAEQLAEVAVADLRRVIRHLDCHSVPCACRVHTAGVGDNTLPHTGEVQSNMHTCGVVQPASCVPGAHTTDAWVIFKPFPRSQEPPPRQTMPPGRRSRGGGRDPGRMMQIWQSCCRFGDCTCRGGLVA